MGTVAVTGASGHLGRVLVPYLWERGHIVEPLGRRDVQALLHGDVEARALIHCAAPDYKDDDAVRAFCRESLTGYKQPRVIEFRQELPKTPVGKVLRRELRDKPAAQ